MIDSLDAIQIERIKKLGAWRDEGRRFKVGLDGEVFEHHEDQKEIEDGYARKRTSGREGSAGWEGTAGREGAAGHSSAADSEPAGTIRRATLIDMYLGFRPEILSYYPSAHFRETEGGLWISVRSYPLGRTGPCYWIPLFLPVEATFSPKAFAFERLSPVPRTVGLRHTNFPDASICAFTDEDDAWRPGENPRILLNLYADWLLCQLFLHVSGYWPGPQVGLDAAYRILEFKPNEWCDCGSAKRYSDCHVKADLIEVDKLKASGGFVPLPIRQVPETVIRYASSRWKKLPILALLPMHRYRGKLSSE